MQAPSAPARSPQALSGVELAQYPVASNMSRSSSVSGISEPSTAGSPVNATPAALVRAPSVLGIAAAGA